MFALDSIPAVLAVSQETFIMVTSNIFAIIGLRSLYFVLAGAMAKFEYLKIALGVLLILIGAQDDPAQHRAHLARRSRCVCDRRHPRLGVIASLIRMRRNPATAPEPASPSP